jgi:hypothetical protein
MARLGKIVIVAGDPEDRHHRPLPLTFQDARNPGGREGLIDRLERPSEESRLLPGGDRDGPWLTEAGKCRRSGYAGYERISQRGVEMTLPWRGKFHHRSNGSRHNSQGHPTCPTRMVRGASVVSGEAS